MTTLSVRAIPLARRISALYCATYGSGTPLLLIHGLELSGAMFEPLIPALAARYGVIIPDLRGHGRSARLPASGDPARLAADLDDLLDLLRVRSCFVLGYAAGGAVAQQLARSYPGRVRGLVLVCSYARNATSPVERIGTQARLRLERLRAARAPVASADAELERCAAQHARRLDFDSRTWLRELACPALVVGGTADTATPPQFARELAAHLPAGELRLISGAGHWLPHTHSGTLLDLMLPWLAAQEAAA